MQKVYIYIDECGTPSLELEKKGVLSYMVYCAVILEENSIIKAKNLLSQIILDNHIQQGYLKSSNISNDEKGFNKRVNILTALKSLEHYVVALVIDKSKIEPYELPTYLTALITFVVSLILTLPIALVLQLNSDVKSISAT